jgi:hypothetical protein
MVSPPPRVAIEPSPSSILPLREPIAHRIRSRAVAPPLALFAGGRLYHKGVTYHIPTAKSTRAPPVQLGFAGLCEAFSMSSKEVNGFANLCSSLEKIDHFDPSAFSVLDPVTGELLEHHQLCCDPR